MLTWLQPKVERAVAQYYHWRDFKLQGDLDLSSFKIIAHRGKFEEKAQENCLHSFRKCVELNIEAIEFDIRFSKDDIPVVFHDAHLNRIFNSDDKLSSLRSDEIIKNYPSIPFLKDVVTELSGKIHFFIEIKDPKSVTTKQKENLSQILSPLEPEIDFHLMSLDADGLSQINYPDRCKVGIAILNVNEINNYVTDSPFKGFTGSYFLITNKMVRKHLSQRRMIGTGFLTNQSTLAHELNRGVRWIFTNQAAHIKNLYRELLKQR